MTSVSRRRFLETTAASAAITAAVPVSVLAAYTKLKLGVTDWNLRHAAKPTSIEFAKTIGFDGVEISLGRAPDVKTPPATLPLNEPGLLSEYLDQAKTHQFPIASTCLDILHQNYLKDDPLGKKWVLESIPLTKKLKVPPWRRHRPRKNQGRGNRKKQRRRLARDLKLIDQP